jgi:hypothetical protein
MAEILSAKKVEAHIPIPLMVVIRENVDSAKPAF